MTHRTQIAVPLVDLRSPLAEQVRAAVAAGADWVELRVDRLGDESAVAEFLKEAPHARLIITVRSQAEGGGWTADERERLRLLSRLSPPAGGYRDIELAAWEAYQRVLREEQASFAPARLIVSHHDLGGTPSSVAAILERLAATGAGVIKAVFTPRDATDGLRILDALRAFALRRPTIALGMGEAGLMTRVLARKFGAWLTFAALDADAASAPGQPTIAELRGRFRWDAIDSQTRVFGVVGWPVAHSRSPHVHNAALAGAEINGVYLPLPVQPTWEAFASFMDLADGSAWLDLAGLSVTLPHKEHALRWLCERGHALSEPARACGAVNTLTRTRAGWRGDNTDGEGALGALLGSPDLRASGLTGRSVAILGAGGAARAVAAALVAAGARVVVYNRTVERAAALAGALGCAWARWEDRAPCRADVLINCTQVGMDPDRDSTPIDLPAGDSPRVVFDTVYHPRQTRLLREAAAAGRAVVSGVEMFLAQAAAQFRLWHGRAAPLEIMRAAFEAS